MHGGRHGDGEAERELAADVSDVVDGPSWHPHDVVLARFQNNAARQFPREQGGGPICATTSPMRVCSTLGHVTFVGVAGPGPEANEAMPILYARGPALPP